MGQSLCEWDLIDTARALMDQVDIPMPIDVVVAPGMEAGDQATTKLAAEVSDDDMILDVGPKTAASIAERISKAATILWNGPLGVFEEEPFAVGTEGVGRSHCCEPRFLAGRWWRYLGRD